MKKRGVRAFSTAALLACAFLLAGGLWRAVAEDTPWPPGETMRLLDRLGVGEPMEKFNLRLWGFTEVGFTGRLTGGQDPLPLRGWEGIQPNSAHLEQFRWTLERLYDREKAFDIGARYDGLFGLQAMATHANGLLENSGHRGSDAWFDVLHAYFQLWFKTGEESGLEILGGKFASPIGYEEYDSVNNLIFTHGLLAVLAEPATNTGVMLTYTFNPQFSLFFAPVEGWDVFKDNNHAWTYLAGGTLTGRERVGDNPRTSFTLIADTGPEEAENTRDYRSFAEIIVTQWLTPRLQHALNADIGVEPGAVDGRTAEWGGAAYYLSYIVNDYVTPACRIEWFRDPTGFLTDVPGSYFDLTFDLRLTPMPDHPLLKDLLVRPEIRWDFGSGRVFGGGRRYQPTLGFDVICMF